MKSHAPAIMLMSVDAFLLVQKLINVFHVYVKRIIMYVKCWDCGQEIDATPNIQDQVDMAYNQGYNQAIRDIKNAKIG